MRKRFGASKFSISMKKKYIYKGYVVECPHPQFPSISSKYHSIPSLNLLIYLQPARPTYPNLTTTQIYSYYDVSVSQVWGQNLWRWQLHPRQPLKATLKDGRGASEK